MKIFREKRNRLLFINIYERETRKNNTCLDVKFHPSKTPIWKCIVPSIIIFQEKKKKVNVLLMGMEVKGIHSS